MRDDTKPLFIPLKADYFDAFARGEKVTEYRKHGPRWNARTCTLGRRVVLSKGYGKKHRLGGKITVVEFLKNPNSVVRDFSKLYPEKGAVAICITIELDQRKAGVAS